MTWFVWGLIALAMVLYGFGDYISKLYANSNLTWFAFLATLLYSIVSVVWLVALKEYNHLSILGTVWSVLYAIVTVAVATLGFHEALTLGQMFGVVLGIIAIYFLSA
jgi:multidrug transporter EmrE-like cation transporter